MSHTAAPAIAPSPAPSAPHHAGAYPSDEQILGIVPDGAIEAEFDALLANAAANAAKPRALPAESASRDANAAAQSTANASVALPADAPDWLARASAAAPESAPQLASLWQRASALDTFDRAYYGADAAAQQALVAQLYADDPGALRAMVAAAQQIIASSANGTAVARIPPNAGNAGASGNPGTQHNSVTPRCSAAEGYPDAQSASGVSRPGVENPRPELQDGISLAAKSARDDEFHAAPQSNFDPAAYAQFEQSTNDAVVADVNRAIERALDRALPADISDGARRRIAGDTLAEVHTALRGDRDLAAQVAESLRTGRFTAATRDAVARLIATRARGVVPEAARRVIGEWTGSVLASHRERAAKSQAASARVDVTGGALPAPVPRRALAPRDIDYRATSDEDILSW